MTKAEMPQIGLKLWAPNVGGYLREATRLVADRQCDYVELYTSPDCAKYLPMWQETALPFVIHCAHSAHEFNLSKAGAYDINHRLFGEAVEYLRALKARWIIVHPGILGRVEETVGQLNRLMSAFDVQPHEVLVENKPFINLRDEPCVGASPESVAQIKEECGTGFVLDVGHAIKYAIGAGRPYESVLSQLMTLQPEMLHVSDALMSHPKDEHLHFGRGEFDFESIFAICRAPYISIETVKDHPERLDDFIEDTRILKAFLNKG